MGSITNPEIYKIMHVFPLLFVYQKETLWDTLMSSVCLHAQGLKFKDWYLSKLDSGLLPLIMTRAYPSYDMKLTSINLDAYISWNIKR